MSRKQVFYIIFFAVLVVGFFITLAAVIPGFTKSRYPPIGKVQPFSFINQDGETVHEDIVIGKVVAVNFFFTTCNSICPKMNNNLKPVYDEFKSQKDFLLLSHTSDPARDSAATLKKYADSLNVDTKKWMFLTGRKDSLYSIARHAYRIDDPQNFVQDINDDFLHTQFVALLNKKGEVVHIYDGIRPTEIREMQNRIRTLLNE